MIIDESVFESIVEDCVRKKDWSMERHAPSLQYGRRHPKHFQRGRLPDKSRVLLSDGTGFCAACGAEIGGHRCAEPQGGRWLLMALYHFHVEQIKRSEGRTAVASAAYRAYAPERFSDRYTLWNEVEQIEKHYKAQLAYSFDMALQNEISLEENIALAREFVQKYFVYPLYKIPTTCLYCFKTILQFFFSSFTHFCKEISSASDLVSRMIAGIPLSSGRYQPSGLSITPLNPNWLKVVIWPVPCFYSKAFLMSHSLQTVNLFCTLFFCLFRPDRSSRL